MIDTALIWDRCLEDLRYQVKDNVFTMWLRPLSAHIEAKTLVIRAPNDYFVTYIKKNHLGDIQQLVAKHSQDSIEDVVVRVDNVTQSDSYDTTTNTLQTSGSLFGYDELSPTLASQNKILKNLFWDASVGDSSSSPNKDPEVCSVLVVVS